MARCASKICGTLGLSETYEIAALAGEVLNYAKKHELYADN